jgi:cytochrome P450/glutathione S-transferase
MGAPMSPPVELQRWLRDLKRRPYEFRPRAAGLHAREALRRNVPVELPLMLLPEGAVGGLLPSITALEERLPPRETLFPRPGDRGYVEALCGSLFSPAVRTYYFHMLPERAVLAARASSGTPRLDAQFVRLAYPTWRRLLTRGLKLDGFDAAAAAAAIDSTFSEVEADLGTRPFLAGDEPGIRDIVFAVLVSPVILPPGHPASIPTLDELPEAFRTRVEAWRGRPAGELALRVYERRPAPIDWGKVPSDRPTLSQRLLPPKLLRGGARLAARSFPRVLKLGKTAYVSRFADVDEVLARDGDFLIAPVNARRIEGVMGPFILGMDNSAELQTQRRATYRALAGTDHSGAAALVASEAERFVTDAAARFGKIDVVNGFARPIAARAALTIFGIRGPSEADLMRAVRAVFHETFLNLSGEAKIERAGRDARAEIASWIKQEAADRGGRPNGSGDLVDRLLEQAAAGELAVEQIPWITAGLLVGSIDTTATVVANITCEIVTDRALAKAVRRDVDNPRRLIGWCWEALRRRPHNPLLIREAAADVSLAGKSIPAGSRVWALTLPAMQDARVFPNPSELRPDRPLEHYMHFGRGLHRCSGRELNERHIPTLVAALVRHGVSGPHDLRFRGPFPDRLVVSLERAN